MPWRCPDCHTEIQHSLDQLPDPRDEYRCHVCRIKLWFDPVLRMMVVAPLDTYRQVTDALPMRTGIPARRPRK